MSALTTSQAAAGGDHPDWAHAWDPSAVPRRLLHRLYRIYFFPANGSQITSIATDETGTTHISKYAIWHSFSLPMFVMWLVGMIVALIVAIAVYGTSAPS